MRGALDVPCAKLWRLPCVDDDEAIALAVADALRKLRGVSARPGFA